MKLLATITLTALAAGGLVATPLATSATAAPFELTSGFADLVVDQAHGRVFVSGGPVVVANASGTVTGSVPGLTDARQMTLTPDGTQLVVAAGDGLTVVDAATATVVRTIPTGEGSCPDALTPASGQIFFTYGDCEGGTPGLGAVDLGTDAVTTDLAPGAPSPVDAVLDSVPSTPSLVTAIFGTSVVVLDTTGGEVPTATVRVSGSGGTGTPVQDLALKPGATRMLTAGPGVQDRILSTTDLMPYRAHANSNTPTAVAYRADALAFAVGFSTGVADAQSYYGSAQTPTSHYLFPDGTTLEPRGLAFGQYRLYGVGRTATDGFVIAAATVGPPAKIAVTTDHSVYRYKSYAVVTVALPTPTLNRAVRLYTRTATGKKLLRSGTVSATSRKIQFKVQVTKNTRFRAEFAGDEIYRPSSSERVVKVRSKVVLSSASTSLSGSYHRLKGSPAPIVSGTVYPASGGVCVQVSGQILVGGRWASIGQNDCLRTTSTSRFGLKLIGFRPGDRIRVFAKVKANATNVESPQAVYYVLIT